MFKSWFGLTLDAVLLGFETQRVIGLRLAIIAAGGPAAQVEAHRMVMEKTTALAEAATTLATCNARPAPCTSSHARDADRSRRRS